MIMNLKKITLGALLSVFSTSILFSAENAEVVETSEVEPEPVVYQIPEFTAKDSERDTSYGMRLPDILGAKIYQGKKISLAEFSEKPEIVNNNYRQAFSELPGLLVSETRNPSIVNVTYRGFGEPHESQNILTLKDGIPITSDLFGYPTTYFTPNLEAVERIELIRGGSSLLYGPQPGPVINYVTYYPPTEEGTLGGRTLNLVGTDDLFSTYNQIYGNQNGIGFIVDAYYSYSDGSSRNSAYDVYSTTGKFVVPASENNRWVFSYDVWTTESEEPELLSDAQYRGDREQDASDNEIEIDKYIVSATKEIFRDGFTYTGRNWFDYQDRTSYRGTEQKRLFRTWAHESRALIDWEANEIENNLAAGFLLYYTDSKWTRNLDNGDGIRDRRSDRNTYYGSIFAENKINLGDLTIAPAARVEFIELESDSDGNSGTYDDTYYEVVPLLGISSTYQIDNTQIYASIYQGYQSPNWDQVAPTDGSVIDGSPDATESYEVEVGVKGEFENGFNYDASLFYGLIDNKIEETDDDVFRNSGTVEFYGAEFAMNADIFKLAEIDDDHSLELHANLALLDAEITDSDVFNSNGDSLEGNTPGYAPDVVAKWGLTYRFKNTISTSLTGVYYDEHYHNDGNFGSEVPDQIPSYVVFDWNVDWQVHEHIKLIAGINNILDEDYYSRVRRVDTTSSVEGDVRRGIEPAPERNVYVGAEIKF